MKKRDKIPLEAIQDNAVLAVPTRLSRQAALRLIARGWAQWNQVEYTKHGKPKGFVELTLAGRRAI